MRWQRAGLAAQWMGGGLYLEAAGQGLLLDAPAGAVALLGDQLARLQAVVLSSGRPQAVGGLVPLLCGLARFRRPSSPPLSLFLLAGEERGPALAAAWMAGWPGAYPLSIDTVQPGMGFEAAGMRVQTHPLRCGEPVWANDSVRPCPGVGLRVQTPGASACWLPLAAPDVRVQRAARAELVVVEVGVTPWPRSPSRWRCTPAEAVELSQSDALWLVGDDGCALRAAQA